MLKLLQRMIAVTGASEQLPNLQTSTRLVGQIGAQREQLGERAGGLIVVEEESNQFEPYAAARVGQIGRPRRIQRIVIEAERLGDVLTLGGQAGELQIHVGVLGRRVSQRQQRGPRGFAGVIERERARERKDIRLVGAVPDGGPAKRVDRFVQLAGRDRALSAPKPLGGIAEAHVPVVRRQRTREEKSHDRDQEQDTQLKNFAVDGCGPLRVVVRRVGCGSHGILNSRTRLDCQLSTGKTDERPPARGGSIVATIG